MHVSHYKSNLRDIEFNLLEVLGRGDVLGQGPYAEMDVDTAREVLHEIDRLAKHELAESFAEADRDSAGVRPRDAQRDGCPRRSRRATTRTWTPSGSGSSCRPSWVASRPRRHCAGPPPSWCWARTRRCTCTPPARTSRTCSGATAPSGTSRSRSIMIDRGWGATMVLTEPDAGSDVGAGRAKAFLQEDGSWHIEGVKRFITSGEHDMTENIVHLVLARPQGVEGAGGPGTKGLSLFVVPKYHFDLETGELTGERNGAFVTERREEDGHQGVHHLRDHLRRRRPGEGLAARRGAQRHRADVPGDRVRPDDGRHQGDRHPVHRLPERARVRQGAGAGRRT